MGQFSKLLNCFFLKQKIETFGARFCQCLVMGLISSSKL